MSYMKAVVVNPAKTNKTGFAPSRRSSSGGSSENPTFRESGRLEEHAMECLVCKDLEQAFVYRRRQYIEARSAVFYQVSTELAARKNVDMERSKSDLEDHTLVCKVCYWTRDIVIRASSVS